MEPELNEAPNESHGLPPGRFGWYATKILHEQHDGQVYQPLQNCYVVGHCFVMQYYLKLRHCLCSALLDVGDIVLVKEFNQNMV